MKLRAVAALGLTAALALTACGGDNGGDDASQTPDTETTAEETEGEDTEGDDSEGEGTGEELSGSVAGEGASSKLIAENAWMSSFMDQNPGVQLTYPGNGSGAGRDAITGGQAFWAGADSPFAAEDNVAGAFGACSDDSAVIQVPSYISPIAIPYNLEGVDELNLDYETLANIFTGNITSWDDAAIADLNPDVELPALAITVVHRSDESGTTGNFSDFLVAVAPDIFTEEPTDNWPYGGQGAEKTDGVVSAVGSGNGTIGYADASAVGDLNSAKLGGGESFSGPEPEAAAQIVDNSPQEEGREPYDMVIELDREAEGYALVLIAYQIACQSYDDPATAAIVKEYLKYVVSPEGQELAAQQAGSAPLSEELSAEITEILDTIS